MEPPLDARARPQLDDARHPDSEDTYTSDGDAIVSRRPAYGAWDAEADTDLQPASRRTVLAGGRRPGKLEIRRAKLTQVALAMRASGEAVPDIAARLGVAASTVIGWFTAHRRAVDLDAIDVMLDRTAVPLATENLIHGLLAGDKDYTLETLKGRGVFKRHAAGDAKPPSELPTLTIRFETGNATPSPPAADGSLAAALDARLPERVGSASATPATTRLPRGGGSRYARAHRARLY